MRKLVYRGFLLDCPVCGLPAFMFAHANDKSYAYHEWRRNFPCRIR